MLEIAYIHIKEIENHFPDCLSLLNEERRNKALKYFKKEDCYRSVASSLLIKHFIGGFDIYTNKDGKPFIKDGYFFNISHSHEYVFIIYHPNFEVGIDIQYGQEQIDSKMIDYCLNEEEKKQMNDNHDFYKYWTIKESMMKCLGTGIQTKMKNIPAPKDLDTPYLYQGISLLTHYETFFDYYLSFTYQAHKKEEFRLQKVVFDDLK